MPPINRENPLCSDPSFLALGVPEEAWPCTAKLTGQKSYTRVGPAGIKIEVHFSATKSQQFFIKQVRSGYPIPLSPNVNWNRFGGVEAAWAKAKEVAGWATA